MTIDNIVFLNVDTQIDFIESKGKLPVPNAESIKPELKRLTEMAEKYKLTVINTCDWHNKNSKELSITPDYINTFPEHCMENTEGANFIKETAPKNPFILDYNIKSFLAEDAIKYRNIVIRKDKFDLFSGNPYSNSLFEHFDKHVFIVYGVAENVCVNFAVEGLLSRGKEVYIVKEATKGLPGIDSTVESWKLNGGKIIEINDIEIIINNYKQYNIIGGIDLVDGVGQIIKRNLK
jgi:nicotinamidase/pyrazinamidase